MKTGLVRGNLICKKCQKIFLSKYLGFGTNDRKPRLVRGNLVFGKMSGNCYQNILVLEQISGNWGLLEGILFLRKYQEIFVSKYIGFGTHVRKWIYQNV